MPYWLNSLLFAILVVTIPFTMIGRILSRLPRPDALTHRRWPSGVNLVLIGAITAYVTIFIRSAYYVRGSSAVSLFLQFLIAALAYGFGLVLILRQFTGIYPEFIVTTGSGGLGIRKISYRTIVDLEEIWRGHGETRFRVHTIHGTSFKFTVPTRSVSLFVAHVRAASSPD